MVEDYQDAKKLIAAKLVTSSIHHDDSNFNRTHALKTHKSHVMSIAEGMRSEKADGLKSFFIESGYSPAETYKICAIKNSLPPITIV